MSNSNIHGVDDIESNNSNEYQYSSEDKTFIFHKFNYKGDPRNQPILNFLKEAICPFFFFKSFSFIIIVINILIYISSFIPNGFEKSRLDQYFLPPSYKTLDLFGELCGTSMRKKTYEFYRWFTHNLLHVGFEHIFSNCFAILVIGTMLEYLIGTWRYILIYILSGLLGGLFSVLIEPNAHSVGASICICGLISALMGFFIINWEILPTIFGIQNRCYIIFFPLMMIFMTIPLVAGTYQGSGIDYSQTTVNVYGHIGGLIFGFFLSFIFIKPKDESNTCCFSYKIWFFSSIVICCCFALIGYLCFYLLDSYK